MKTGDTVGSYQLIGPIGRGGMGEVWRARHRYLKRDAAVKFVRSDALTPRQSSSDRIQILKRFEREARVTSNLKSPHTIQIFDFGATDDGGFYYAMELLDAISLEDLVRRYGPVPEGRVIHLMRQVCESLEEAHHAGLIHRDIKPGNLLLCRLGLQLDFMKVLDFGLVRRQSLQPGDSLITQGAGFGGTPSYMSPEAITGSRELDARSDIYAVGAVCYWLTTGSTVFDYDSLAEIMAAQVRDVPDPPSSVTEMSISPEMDALILACLSKDPDRRPASVSELRNRLARCSVECAWNPEQALAWWSFHKPETLFGMDPGPNAHGSASTSDRTGMTSPSAVSATPAVRALVVLPLANLSSDSGHEAFVLGLHDALISELARIGALTVISRTSALAYRDTTKPVRKIARELHVDAVLEGTVLRERDEVRISLRLILARTEQLLWSDTYDRPVRDVLPLHADIARAVSNRIRVSLTAGEVARLDAAAPILADVYELYLRGRQLSYGFEESDLYRALEHFRDAIALDPEYAPAHAGIGRCYNELASYGFLAPSEALPKASSAVRKALELDDDLAEGHASLAYAMVFFDWNFAASRVEFERALDLEPSSASCLMLFGRYLSLVGEFDHAREVLTRACAVDPLSPIPLFWQAWSTFMARDYDRSITELEGILEAHPRFPYAVLWMATDLVLEGQKDRAIMYAAQVEEAVGLSNDHNLLCVLGWTWGKAGRHDKARRILEHFHSVSRHRWVDPAFIAAIHCSMDESEATFTWIERAVSVRSLLLAYLPSHPFFDGWRGDPRYRTVLGSMKGVTFEGK